MSIEDDDADRSHDVFALVALAAIILVLTFLVGSIIFWPAV